MTTSSGDECDLDENSLQDLSESHALTTKPTPTDPLKGVPPLTTEPAHSPEARLAALRLVADSVAQQRQVASWAIMSHPISLAGLGAGLALAASVIYRNRPGDLTILLTTFAGVIMCGLVAIRWAVRGYVELAEGMAHGWLEPSDDVIATWYGESMIAAVVLCWVANGEGRAKRRKGRKGIIKAWTVKLKYRGKGVGAALLEEAVLAANLKGVEGLEFDEDSVYSRRPLPKIFNGVFETRDRQAQATLENAISAKAKFGKRRSKGSF